MEIMRLWEEYYELKIEPSNRSDSTKEKFKHYGTTIKKYFGGMDISEIKGSFYQKQFNKFTLNVTEDYAKRINNEIRKMIYFAQADGYDVIDFTKGVDIFAKKCSKEREDKSLQSREDYEAVLQEVKKRFNYERSVSAYVIYILFNTGLRPAEALALKWRDMDLIKGFLTTRGRIDTVTLKRTKPKTKHSVRTISFNDETLQVFRELKDSQKKMLKEREMKNPEDLVFLHWSCKNLLPTNTALTKVLRSILDYLKIEPRISLYGIRHSRISYLRSSGMLTDEQVAKYSGHANTGQIIRTYGILLKEIEDAGNEQIRKL